MTSVERLAPQWYRQLSGINGYGEATQSRPSEQDPRAASTLTGAVIVIHSEKDRSMEEKGIDKRKCFW